MNKSILFILGTFLVAVIVVHAQNGRIPTYVIRPRQQNTVNPYLFNFMRNRRQPSFSQQDGYLYALRINEQYSQANEAQNNLRILQAIRQSTYDTQLGGALNLGFSVLMGLLALNITGAAQG